MHPVSIRWLIGQDTKSYTVFQCLPVSAKPGKLTVFTRGTEEIEFRRDTMADELRLYNGREPEDPMPAFARFLDELGIPGTKVGMEVPGGYLQPGHYNRIKSLLGDSLVQDPCGILMGLRAVKSPAELAYVREAAKIGALALHKMIDAVAEGRVRARAGRGRLPHAAQQRQRPAGQHHEPDDRRAQRLCAGRADGAPDAPR